jgi:hypothetical protein
MKERKEGRRVPRIPSYKLVPSSQAKFKTLNFRRNSTIDLTKILAFAAYLT